MNLNPIVSIKCGINVFLIKEIVYILHIKVEQWQSPF